jgi:serine/threonine protein kinase
MENRYNISHQIGQGAFGKVYLATLKKQNDQQVRRQLVSYYFGSIYTVIIY